MEICGYKQYGDGDKIQCRAIRYFLGVHTKAPLLALEGDMGWTSSKTHHHINMIRLWNKFINMDESRINKRVFNLHYQIWSLQLKDILHCTGLNQIYDIKNICNIDAAKCICANLRNVDWKNSILTKPKLQTFITFKENIETESYIKYCMLRRRSLLAQLRLGILTLHLKMGCSRNKKCWRKNIFNLWFTRCRNWRTFYMCMYQV